MLIKKISLILLLGFFLPVGRGAVLDQPNVESPQPGEVLQGVVMVKGSTDIPGFQSAEALFGYSDDTTGTWFLIEKSVTPVTSGNLAIWDTTTISDGTYNLLVRVYLEDGGTSETIVHSIAISNYSAVEFKTPVSTSIADGVGETPMAESVSLLATPTELPQNPASVSEKGLLSSFFRGAGYALLALVIVGMLLAVRTVFRRR